LRRGPRAAPQVFWRLRAARNKLRHAKERMAHVPLVQRVSSPPMSSSRFFIVLLLANCGSPDERAQRYYEHGIKLLSEKNISKRI
jgi:hypothetical protein